MSPTCGGTPPADKRDFLWQAAPRAFKPLVPFPHTPPNRRTPKPNTYSPQPPRGGAQATTPGPQLPNPGYKNGGPQNRGPPPLAYFIKYSYFGLYGLLFYLGIGHLRKIHFSQRTACTAILAAHPFRRGSTFGQGFYLLTSGTIIT